MRKEKQPLSKRLLATILAMVMVFSMIPNLGVSAQSDAEPSLGIIGSVTDAHTLDSWKLAFDPENISTEHAGGIWTDKSVLSKDNLSALGNVSGLTIGDDNFLVALSALAANSIIVGQGTTPTDTVFVLDISGSLSGTELNAMVEATNDAIHTLLSGNEKNRVGVVLYSTNAYTLLPLDHYTPVTDNGNIEYIERTSGSIRTGRVATGTTGGNGGFPGFPGGQQTTYSYITNSDGDEVNVSVSTGGGTYIQGGLWGALSLFDGVTVSDTRTPVMVLMSDGAPTYTTNNYSNVPEESNYGTGNSSTAGDGFVTGLTASYVKNQIAAKYGADAYLYTLGLGVDNVTNSEIAKAVLDPIDSKHADIEDLWDDFAALATAQNKAMTVELGDSGRWDPSITYTEGLEEVYVDKYFSADEASDLSTQFQKIVNEISLQNGYYVTRLDGETANLGGYITFVDEIGTGMQVKDIKGVLIGEQLYSGARLVQALLNSEFGTENEPTILGDNMVWALKQRLGITETSVIHELIRNAYATGQIGLTTDDADNVTSFSNYIGWFGDANGEFLGFWDAENPDAEIPAGAAYANKCYGMLGTTTNSQTSHASDMMYVSIQVSKAVTNGQILEKTPEQVSFRIPAALLPMVTYQVALDGETVETSTKATVTYKAAEPIRLLYEVGVHDKLTELNIHEFLREGYQAKDENGNYYLYTNAWYWEPNEGDAQFNNPPAKDNELSYVLEDTAKNHLTYAYFEPGTDNEHYYFTHNEQIYTKVGDNYVAVTNAADLVAGNTYYYKHHVYTTTQSGVENAGAIEVLYEKLSPEALAIAIAAGSTVVPEGTMHFYGHSHDLDKDPNATGSFFAVRHHLVDAKINSSNTEEHAYELVYLGNNGRITYAPAQGLSIEKQMADGSTPDAEFTFDVTLTAPAGVTIDGEYLIHYFNKYGGESGDSVEVSGGKTTVTVNPGEKIYILGLPAGTTYTVTERRSDGYLFSDSTGETGTVVANRISEAVFINRVRGVGSLNVVKAVQYLNGAVKNDAAAGKTFPVTVTVTDGDVKFSGTVYVGGAATTVADGVISFNIADGQTVTITGLPEGYKYEVTEGTLPAGYSFVSGTNLTGTITTAAISALLNNSYTPEEVKINDVAPYITITTSKTLESQHNGDFTFEFKLMQFNGTAWEDVYIGGELVTTSITMTEAGTATADLDLSGLTFTKAGTYDFRVVEVIPEIQEPGMTYDRTFHDFEIVVADADLDGQLEISEVKAVGSHTQVAEGSDGFGVTAGFTNTYALNSTKLTIQAKKVLTDITAGGSKNMTLKDGQFKFVLTDTTDPDNPVALTEGNGTLGDILFPTITYTNAGVYTYTVHEVQETKAGYTYDTARYRITVTVSKNGNNLAITDIDVLKDNVDTGYVFDAATFNNILNGDTLTFNNIYKADPTTLTLVGNKTLTNLTPGVQNPDMTSSIKANDYTFALTMKDGTMHKIASFSEEKGYKEYDESQRSTYDGGGIAFNNLYFDAAGTYVFKLVEKEGSKPGVTYDTAEYLITVVVTDNGAGQLVASATYTRDGIPTDKIVFNNTYKAEASEAVTITGSKELTGIRDIVDGEFSFTLSGNGVNETVKNVGKTFTFSSLTFDAVGVYNYTITEVNGGKTLNGVTYDDTVYNVTITVTDDGTGKLKTSVSYGANITAIEFENDYVAAPVKVALTGRKLLAGRPTALEAGEFSFVLTGDKVANGSETVKNDAEGYITFSEITFTEKGTYTFTIQEVIPADKAPGIHYDETVINVTVTVTDNGKGQLVAKVTMDPSQNAENVDFRFFNRYHAEATDEVELGGIKNLVNITGGGNVAMTPGNDYNFNLKGEGVDETVTNNGNSFKFSKLTFDSVGTYVYTITEVKGDKGGITYDDAAYTVTVVVVDDSTGKLKVDSITYTVNGESANGVVFENTYEAKPVTDVVIEAGKVLTDITGGGSAVLAPKDGDFSFNLKGEGVDETVKNVGGKVTFTGLDFNKPGTYAYTITEVKGNLTGFGYDETKYDVTVTVTDNGAGQLVTAVKYSLEGETVEADEVVFSNTFKAADAELTLVGKKTFTGGRDLKEGEFSFNLKGENVDETVTNAADGSFRFNKLTFDKVGTYTFTISEVKGTDSLVKYDEKVYEITVTVTYENGVMTAVAKVAGETVDSYGFTNIFTPAPVSVTITAEKKLTNHTKQTMGVDGFSFLLTDGTTPVTKISGTDGLAKFELTFDAVGTYTYKLSEVKGDVKDMVYDETVYDITVTVTQDPATGKLTAMVSKTDNAVFTNVYGTVEEPPKTADDFALTRWTAMLTVSAFCTMAVLIIGKKKLQEQ